MKYVAFTGMLRHPQLVKNNYKLQVLSYYIKSHLVNFSTFLLRDLGIIVS